MIHRLVAATHKPLRDMAADGSFRQDLFYRISAFPIELPVLRERIEDLPILVDSFLQRMAGDTKPLRITPQAMAALAAYQWPGNIRELRNALERASLFADDGVIDTAQLPPLLSAAASRTPLPGATFPKKTWTDEDLATQARAFAGTQRELARHLGLSERTLYRRLRGLGIDDGPQANLG